jgi:transketolase
MRPSVRLSALMHLPVVYIYTHDSVFLGEDGPTHQPVEHLMALRTIPNLWTLRPADAAETVEAWRLALARRSGPTAICLTRQNLPVVDRAVMGAVEGVHRGGYVLAEATGDKAAAVLVATGSEVTLALRARERLEAEGVPTRVVSLPCWEAFAAQPVAYRRAVIPRGLPTVSVEAGITLGWERIIGADQRSIGIDRFGASAPGDVVAEKLGLTVEAVVGAVHALRAEV